MQIGLGLGLSRQGRGTPPIITGTNPSIQQIVDGQTVADALGSWGTASSSAAPGTEIVTQEMRIDGAAYQAYNGATVLNYTQTLRLRKRVTDGVGTPERIFESAQIAVAGIAPAIVASQSLVGRVYSITISSITGVPAPSLSFDVTFQGNALTMVDQGGGVWSVTVPDSATSGDVIGTATVTNVIDVDIFSGSLTVPANLGVPNQMVAPTLAGGVSSATLTLGAAPTDNGSAITNYQYQVDLAAGDFSSPIVQGGQSPANLGDPISITPLVAGSYKARSRATNVVGPAVLWSNASSNATVTEPVETDPPVVTTFVVGPQPSADADVPVEIVVQPDASLPLTAFIVADLSIAGDPSATQVEAGETGGSVPAPIAWSQAFSSNLTSQINALAAGLNADYDFFLVVKDASGNVSSVVPYRNVNIVTSGAVSDVWTITADTDGIRFQNATDFTVSADTDGILLELI